MTEPSRGAPLPRHVRLWMRLSRRDLRDLSPPECAVRVDPGLAVPAADGVPLLTDVHGTLSRRRHRRAS